MPIRILAPHEAAKIAAGEVIERPASVVKELVENSLDAGSSRVSVEIREGGLALIRVADDGCGIEPGELGLAFERHATSKVASEDDLWRVSTLGFRGEALPSIAAAGEVELLTRVANIDVGTRVRLRDGAIAEEGAGAASPGTVFTVRRLFSAQPARLKFLRSPAGETQQVTAVLTHYAMAYPHVRFELVVDGRTTLTTPGSGGVIDTVAAVYGSEVASAAIEINVPPAADGGTGVRGVVCDPRVHRANRNYISLYVNRRWVKNRSLTFAVEEAYQGMLPIGRRPIAVLDITVQPDQVDVNVHPTKAEVRLRDERAVFGVLQRAVRNAISGRAPVPQATSGLWGGTQASDGGDLDRPPLFLTQRPVQLPIPVPSPPRRDVPIATSDADVEAVTASSPDAQTATMAGRLPLLRAVGQVNAMYVVAEGPDGMYLVDQHAAHERVLYERFLAASRAGHPDAQGLLDAVTVALSPQHRALVSAHAEALAALGFDLDDFGDNTYVVRAVPSALAGGDIAGSVSDLLDRIARDDAVDEPAHRAAASLACHASVRAGMTMSPEEQRELLRLLETAQAPRTCPHGRPTMVHLAADAIARQFGRK